MIRKVITAERSTTVKELISLLETNRIGGVSVVDDNGNLVDIVSDGDIVCFLSHIKRRFI
ncbi:CBS domain-containing protein [Neobacillus niacini]|uniref:CBS domain-containing protein n=1 Tax=Neobacillus niacini TaxID=86668 RepID=UPI00300059C5